MKNKTTIQILFVSILLLSCTFYHKVVPKEMNSEKKHITITNTMKIDTSKIATISYKTTDNIFSEAKATKLSDEDLKVIETLLNNCITEHNTIQKKQYQKQVIKYPEHQFLLEDFVINIENYKRQYVPVINKKGEKEVWINCFCDSWDIDWKKDVLFVFDGGNCYFNLKINLTNKIYYDLSINGEA